MNAAPPDDIMDAEGLMELVREDLKIAEFAMSEEYERGARYHAQQAAEKALKALLIVEKGRYPFTHNLVELVNGLPEKYRGVFDVEGLDHLSPWEVKGRYLANMPDVSDQPMEYLVEVAKNTADTLGALVDTLRSLREAVHPQPPARSEIVPDTAPPRPTSRDLTGRGTSRPGRHATPSPR